MKRLALLICFSAAMQFVASSQDLLVTAIDGVKSVKRYAPITFSATFKNGGTVNITKTTTANFYLSVDNTYSANDYLIGSVSVGAINAGQLNTVPFTTSPSNRDTPVGNYYLIVKADVYNGVTETNESNNQLVVNGYVIETPDVDLYFTSFSIDSQTASPHQYVQFAFNTADKGKTATFGQIPFTFYLSHDQVVDGTDIVMGTNLDYYLTSPGNTMISKPGANIVIPGSVEAGSYYVLVKMNCKANGGWEIQEADMTNNIAVSAPITIIAPSIDLDLSVPGKNSFVSQTDNTNLLYLTFSIRNNGTTPVADYGFTVYTVQSYAAGAPRYNLSANATYQNSLPVEILPGQTVQQIVSVYVSSTDPIMSETFGVVIVVNENKSITETTYTNNELIFTSGLAFGHPARDHGIVDLSLGKYSSGEISDTDTKIPMTATYRNSGTSAIIDFGTYDVDILDCNRNYIATGVYYRGMMIQPGTTGLVNTEIQLQTPLDVGVYTVKARDYSYPGFNFDIPFSVTTPYYTFNGNIEGEDGIPINKGELFVYQKGANGIISLLEQKVLTPYSGFNLNLKKGDYALYFVPDETSFSGYVPTVTTKSLTVNDASFTSIADNKAITFQILKTHPPTEGTKFIEGNIIEDPSAPSGRLATGSLAVQAISGVTVVLFSESGEILEYTKSDDAGYYKFDKLPNGKYQVLPIFAFDHLQAQGRTDADLTRVNAKIDFTSSKTGVTASVTELLLDQILTFDALPDRKYKDEPFKLEAFASSNLAVTYVSSDPDIAQIDGDQVIIKGAGDVTITAVQSGDDTYLPVSVPQGLTIGKADQILMFSPLAARVYGDEPFVLAATADSELPVSFTSSNEEVAKFEDGKLVIKGAGESVITAIQSGDNLFQAATSIEQTLLVSKASQTITFEKLPTQVKGGTIELPLNSSAGLPIKYTSTNEAVATVNGNVLDVHQSGEATITATQEGNSNYEPAHSVEQGLLVQIILGLEVQAEHVGVGPNPTNGRLRIYSKQPIHRVSISDLTGRLSTLAMQEKEVDISAYAPGIYVLTIEMSGSSQIVKVVKY